jgi:7,8-dihydroneopterin aldolase/epimerase/oxygenase
VDVLIEIEGLEVTGFHGATRQEKNEGQPFLFDILLIAHDAGVRSDHLADTVDYTEVAARVREICQGHRFNLIEALAAAIVDDLMEHFPISRARVRVRKPRVLLGTPVEFTAATIERTRR